MNIGTYLRKARKSQGLTLLELSKKSNVALATLSRIETGKMTGTLDSHVQIAKALSFTLPEFYSEIDKLTASQQQPRESDYANLFIHNKGASSVILTKDIFTKKMLPVLIELQRGAKTHKEELKIGAEKFIYCLNGKIEVIIDEAGAPVGRRPAPHSSGSGNKKILRKGATLYLDASRPHYIRNMGKGEATCLCVVTPVSL